MSPLQLTRMIQLGITAQFQKKKEVLVQLNNQSHRLRNLEEQV